MLEFLAVSNRTYRVLHRDAVQTGPWLPVFFVDMAPTNRVVTWTNAGPGYFRLLTQGQ